MSPTGSLVSKGGARGAAVTEHRGLPEVGGASKLPYGRPTLTDLGSLADVTKGTGPGNDFTDAPTYGTTSIS